MEAVTVLIEQAHKGDKEARDQLVANNIGLVWSIVRRFLNRGCEAEDLFQIGSIGLLKAIDKFDLNYQVKLSTYAVPMISGEIKRFLRDDGMLKVSRSLKELSCKIFLAKEELLKKQGREPTIEEIAEFLQVEKEEVVWALESGNEVDSLNRSIYQQDGSEIRLMDKLVEEETKEEEVLNRLLVDQLLEGLNKEERQVIYLRYFQEVTQSEVGARLGISQVQVSRMEKKILERLRNLGQQGEEIKKSSA